MYKIFFANLSDAKKWVQKYLDPDYVSWNYQLKGNGSVTVTISRRSDSDAS